MAIATISEIIQRGGLSIGYAANDNAKGALFGKRLAAPGSPQIIAMVTDALTWANDGAITDAKDIREIGNYLVWLIGKYGQQAAARLGQTDGGGSLVPGGGGDGTADIYPFVITSDDFESDGTSYNNADIVGDNLMIFINEWTQQWLLAPTAFIYTSTGIQIVLEGFDANTFDYTIVIQKRNTG